jgi:hypothetical protein
MHICRITLFLKKKSEFFWCSVGVVIEARGNQISKAEKERKKRSKIIQSLKSNKTIPWKKKGVVIKRDG